MRFRLLSALLAMAILTGCPTDKNDPKKKAKAADKTKDESGDVAFQGFIGRLRVAVDKRDKAMLSSMMASDFGYRWDNPPEGDDPFIYWDRTNAWRELSQLMRSRWVPHDGYMVSPPEFAQNPAGYGGYRAGVRMVNGSWRFIYFVPAAPAEAAAPPPSPSPAPTSLL